VWSLPLDARLKKQTDSAIADLCNTPTNNAAISASAAWLLHHFCPPTFRGRIWILAVRRCGAKWTERGIGEADSAAD
jgi:leucyl aminopeptidase